MLIFKEDVIRETFEELFGGRIICLAACGSIVNGRSSAISDLDLLLVLDTYQPNDLSLGRQAVQSLHNYSVDLSLQYANELPIMPEDFQDGSKTSLALTYISSAHVIAGTNIFRDMFQRLPKKSLQRSIIKTLEEYLHQMYALAFKSSDTDEVFKTAALKYLTRSIVDTMLYYEPSDMAPYKGLTKLEILERSKQYPQLRHITSHIGIDTSPLEMIQAMRAIVLQLKKGFGIMRQ